MTQTPPPMPYAPARSYPPARTSAAAVTAFVTGLLSVIPCLGLVTIPIALVTAVVGFVATGRPGVKGRWMAVVGGLLALTLGVLVNGVVVGGGIWGATRGVAYVQELGAVTAEVEAAAVALKDGDAEPMMAFVDEGEVSREELWDVAEELGAIGPDVQVVDEGGANNAGGDAGQLPDGTNFLKFDLLFRGAGGARRLDVEVRGQGLSPRAYKIVDLTLRDPDDAGNPLDPADAGADPAP